MHVAFLQHQVKLFFREVHVDRGERDGVKGQVPGGIPGIFLLVRHGDDVLVHHVEPFAVPHRHLAGPHRIDATRYSFTTLQVLSGSNSVIAVAVSVVAFPRSFCNNTPSWLMMNVITPELPYSAG